MADVHDRVEADVATASIQLARALESAQQSSLAAEVSQRVVAHWVTDTLVSTADISWSAGDGSTGNVGNRCSWAAEGVGDAANTLASTANRSCRVVTDAVAAVLRGLAGCGTALGSSGTAAGSVAKGTQATVAALEQGWIVASVAAALVRSSAEESVLAARVGGGIEAQRSTGVLVLATLLVGTAGLSGTGYSWWRCSGAASAVSEGANSLSTAAELGSWIVAHAVAA